MDLTTLTDEELDALQLAVNTEIGARLQKTRMTRRIADAMGQAASAGVPDEDIATSFAEAKTIAKVKYTEPTHSRPAANVTKTSATPRKRRSSSGFRANNISQ